MEKLILLALLIGTACTLPMEDAAWREYKLQFGKFYKDPNAEVARYAIWKQKLREIVEHNGNSKHTYKKGLNHFSDLVRLPFNLSHTTVAIRFCDLQIWKIRETGVFEKNFSANSYKSIE